MTEGGTREYDCVMLEGVETMTRLPDCHFLEDIFDTFPDFKVTSYTNIGAPTQYYVLFEQRADNLYFKWNK